MRSFFDELRHRNVFRVAAAYAVVGWLLAQVADLVADAFDLPDAFLRMVIVALVLGLPVALFLAWAYELTPEGVRKASELPADIPKDPRSGRALNRVTIVTLLVAVAWLGWDRLERDIPAPSSAASAEVLDKSIAVLPFADFSPGADHAWFADGLTDEILNALARISDLRVASRSSSFQYRGAAQDLPAVAAELHVAHVLEGSVRRAGDRIRVTAQLIRATDDAHLWSETFDASSDDSIDIQERIAFEIASILDTAMDPAELEKMVAAGTDSIPAWEAYVRLRELYYRAMAESNPSGYGDQMVALYQEIVTLDPAFGEAHLLFAQIVEAWRSPANILAPPPGMPPEELETLFRDAATAAARHARTEDARLGAETLRAEAQLRYADLVELTGQRLVFHPHERAVWSEHLNALLTATRYEDAAAFARRAVAHDFGNEEQMAALYVYVARADLDAGLAGVERMLAPVSPAASDLYQSHRILLMAGRVAEAAAVGQRYIDVATDPTWSLMVRIRQACAEGRIADAERYYEEFDFSPFDPATSNLQWLALATLGRSADAVELLRPLDRPATFARLADLLSYPHFDPSMFPNLAKRLEEQGVMRHDIRPMTFACKRD